MEEFQVVTLFGNSQLLLDAFFYRVFGIHNVRTATTELGGEEWTYTFSDRHMELSLTDLHLQHIKQVTKNSTLSKRKFLFYIRYQGQSIALLQHQLKNIIEHSPNAIFIISSPSRSDIHPTISHMALQLHVGFPLDQLQAFCARHRATLGEVDPSPWYHVYPNDSISLLLRMFYPQKTHIERAIEHFLATCEKEENELTCIMECRELSYKLFHINFPLANIAKLLFHVLPSHTHADFTVLAATSDHLGATTKKDVMTYERFFLQTLQILRSSPPKKRVVRKVSAPSAMLE